VEDLLSRLRKLITRLINRSFFNLASRTKLANHFMLINRCKNETRWNDVAWRALLDGAYIGYIDLSRR